MHKGFAVFLAVISLISFLFSGCTSKKNPVGFVPGIEPREVIIGAEYFSDESSYTDSTANYINNSILLVGNFNSNGETKEARSLLSLGSLPDSLFSIESDVTMQLQIREKYNIDVVDNEFLKVGLLLEPWQESEATWFVATDSTEWTVEGADFTEITSDELEIYSEEDTLYIKLPNEILFDWVQEDSTDFGLILYTEQEDAFLEIYSSEYTYDDESVFNPNVNFDYYYTAGDSILDTYDQELNEDTFIYSHDFNYQNFTGQLFVSNIRPVRMLVKIGLEDSIFINMDNSGIEDNDDYRRMTINRAEIILVSNDSEPYPLDGSFSLRSYLVTADSLDFNDISVPLVPDGGYEFLYDDTVTDTLGTEAFSVDVTNIIQYITSGERENKGIMIRSIYENKDFKHMAFATSEDSDELIRPVLKIIYTPPYLDDEK